MSPSAFSVYMADALRTMTPCELPRGPSIPRPAASEARVLRAIAVPLPNASQPARWMGASRRRHCQDNARGICHHPIGARLDAFSPQHCQGPLTYVLRGKAVFTQNDIARSRRAISVYTQHIAAIADVAMPALRRTRLDGKPRVDRGH